jgi:hypothetical protein
MADVVGKVTGEGGPLFLVDRVAVEDWSGSDGDGADYARVMALPNLTGRFELRSGEGAIAWEMEGAGTATLYRVRVGDLVLQRDWTASPAVLEPAPEATVLGDLEIASGSLVVMWAPVAWSDLWDPPAVSDAGPLSMPTMLNVGVQVAVPPGRYTIREQPATDANRCWISLGADHRP